MMLEPGGVSGGRWCEADTVRPQYGQQRERPLVTPDWSLMALIRCVIHTLSSPNTGTTALLKLGSAFLLLEVFLIS